MGADLKMLAGELYDPLDAELVAAREPRSAPTYGSAAER